MDKWDELADSWDSNPDALVFNQHAAEEIQRRRTLTSTTVVLDFGCGTGLLTAKLKGVVGEIVGVDTSAKMVEHFKQKFPDVEVYAADFRELQSSMVGRFDVIAAASVLRFVEELPETLVALVASLKPKGRLIHFDGFNEENDDYQDGFNKEIAQRLYGEAGLEMVESDVADFEVMIYPAKQVFIGVAKKKRSRRSELRTRLRRSLEEA